MLKHQKHPKRFYLIPEYNIQNADVFNNPEFYEIELELSKINNSFDTTNVLPKIKNGIKLVLSGLQNKFSNII